MHLRIIKIQPKILPAVRSVSEDFLNYTKQYQCVDTFITSQKQKDMQVMPATVRRGYLMYHLITIGRDNATHHVNYDGCCLFEM